MFSMSKPNGTKEKVMSFHKVVPAPAPKKKAQAKKAQVKKVTPRRRPVSHKN
jgi:hypothetical protein